MDTGKAILLLDELLKLAAGTAEQTEAIKHAQRSMLAQEINEYKRLKELAVKQQDFDRACLHRDQIDKLREELEQRIG